MLITTIPLYIFLTTVTIIAIIAKILITSLDKQVASLTKEITRLSK